jgi:hypothetical protein
VDDQMNALRHWIHGRYRRLALGIACCLLVLLLPSPLSHGYAEFWARTAVNFSNVGTIDGCSFNCDGCGATAMQKTIFGYDVRLEYACGMLPSDDPKYHQVRTVFGSFIGTVHAWP